MKFFILLGIHPKKRYLSGNQALQVVATTLQMPMATAYLALIFLKVMAMLAKACLILATIAATVHSRLEISL